MKEYSQFTKHRNDFALFLILTERVNDISGEKKLQIATTKPAHRCNNGVVFHLRRSEVIWTIALQSFFIALVFMDCICLWREYTCLQEYKPD